jgi:hypothetical protein
MRPSVAVTGPAADQTVAPWALDSGCGALTAEAWFSLACGAGSETRVHGRLAEDRCARPRDVSAPASAQASERQRQATRVHSPRRLARVVHLGRRRRQPHEANAQLLQPAVVVDAVQAAPALVGQERDDGRAGIALRAPVRDQPTPPRSSPIYNPCRWCSMRVAWKAVAAGAH